MRAVLTLAAASVVLWAALVGADVYTYPVKSINLASAMSPSFYTMLTGTQLSPVADLHPVNGIEASDGSFVLAGKGMISSTNAAFAIKLNSTGSYLASWTSGLSDANAANAVVQLPSGGDLLVAGWRNVSGVGHRCITKLRLSDLSEVWTATFDDSAGSHGALEMISLASGNL